MSATSELSLEEVNTWKVDTLKHSAVYITSRPVDQKQNLWPVYFLPQNGYSRAGTS